MLLLDCLESQMHKPNKIHLHKRSGTLEMLFAEQSYNLAAEYLRVHSPSAEVRGHGVGQATLVYGKINVGITDIKPVGNYGIQIFFDDDHHSGIYSWPYLYDLCIHEKTYWQHYLTTLKQEKQNRDPHTSTIRFSP